MEAGGMKNLMYHRNHTHSYKAKVMLTYLLKKVVEK